MNKKFFSLFLYTTMALTISCTVFSPIKTEQQTTYVLNKLPHVTRTPSSHPKTLLISRLETQSLYQTQQMIYTLYPYEIAYFAKNSWAAPLSDMIQPLLVQTLQNTHHFQTILSQPISDHYDYVLTLQIQKLLQNYTHAQGLVFLDARAQIVRTSDDKVIATQVFFITQPMMQKNPYYGVIASNEATALLLQQLAHFCVQSIP